MLFEITLHCLFYCY